MKRFVAFICSVAVALLCFGCAKEDNNKIKVNEVTHSIFYAPFYLAMEMGYFGEYGIDIDLTNGGGSDASMTALLSGSADVALLGPETAVYTSLGSPTDQPVIFSQLTKRDGSFLMGRVEQPNFTWDMLENKEIIAGRKGGSPAMSLEYAVNKNGLKNGKNVTLNFDVQFNLTVAAFEGGTGDYVTMFEPTASEYVRLGKGYMIASVGEESGEIPFTCFMVKQSYFDKNETTLVNFNKALLKAMNYLYTENETTVAEKLVNSFPSTQIQSIADAIKSYKRIDAWKRDLIMKETDFNRLQEVMENAGELDRRADYDKIVNNDYAEKANG